MRDPAEVFRLISTTSALPAPSRRPDPALWFPPGRLVELRSARSTACTTMAVAAVLGAQAEGETTAWVQPRGGALFPPDLAESGVDLTALIVVHVGEAAGEHGAPKAAEMLLRSGGFGLVVLDLRPAPPRGDAWIGRLLGLAREHGACVVLITGSRGASETPPSRAPWPRRALGAAGSRSSLGSLISLRVEPRRARANGSFRIDHAVLKDKLGWFSDVAPDVRRGPWGLR
jgi:recombination protein RecA